MLKSEDLTKKELVSWIEGLTSSQFKQIEEFFDTMPKLSHTVEVMNPNTQKKNTVVLEGLTSFFGLVMSQMNLEAYYRINFALMQFHKYSLTEIENMMPWERDIYVGLLKQHIEDENLKKQQRSLH